MGYIENNLMSGEEIVYKAKIHWLVYFRGIVFLIIGIFSLTNSETPFALITGAILFLFGLALLIEAFILKISTELAITTKRIIAKFGLIKRTTIELNHSKVESLLVNQGILQRIFNAGTLVIQGTGGGKTPIPSIDDPLVFRTKAIEIIDNVE